ncbi:hypothetical protein MauCBS54593_001512 [Microsporum audouinii]
MAGRGRRNLRKKRGKKQGKKQGRRRGKQRVSSKASPQGPPFCRLPPELHFYILEFLDHRDLQQLRCTNRYFKHLPSNRDKFLIRQRYVDDFFEEEKEEKEFEDVYLNNMWSERNIAVTLRCYFCFRRRHICMYADSQRIAKRKKGGEHGWKRYCVICGMKKKWWVLGTIHRLEWSIGIYCRLCYSFQILPYRRHCKAGLCEVCEWLTDFVEFDVSDTNRRKKRRVSEWGPDVVEWGVDKRPLGYLSWHRVRRQVLRKIRMERETAGHMRNLVQTVDERLQEVRRNGPLVETICNQWACSPEYPEGWTVRELFGDVEE